MGMSVENLLTFRIFRLQVQATSYSGQKYKNSRGSPIYSDFGGDRINFNLHQSVEL